MHYLRISLLFFCLTNPCFAENEDLFDQEDSDQEECQNRPCKRYPFTEENFEEEKYLLERNESYWPGKREGSWMDELTHY